MSTSCSLWLSRVLWTLLLAGWLALPGGCSSNGDSHGSDAGPDAPSADAAGDLAGDGPPEGDGPLDPDAAPPRPAHCNPLTLDHCLLPWPSSFFLRQDATTTTGFRVDYPEGVLPRTKSGVDLDRSRYNLLDGFSTGSQPIAFFAEGVGAAGLPGLDDPDAGTGDESRVWILEHATGARVPLFAEIDAYAASKGRSPALLIRPLAPLAPDARYVVVLRQGLQDATGAALQPPEPFARLRDGQPIDAATEPALAAEAQRLAPVLAFLSQQGVDLEQVLLAWDFHTASDEAVTGNLLGMVDEALAKLPADGPSYTVTEVVEHPVETHPELWFEIHGQMDVPSFLASDDPDAWLQLDADGRPEYRAVQQFPFQVQIPRCAAAAAGPLPIVIYGHGLFGLASEEMMIDHRRQLFDRLCMVAAGTDWRGFSELDRGSVIEQVLFDFGKLPRITDPLQQAHVNFQALVELMLGKFLADPAMQIDSAPVSDGSEIYYLGISLGGIEGVPFAALSKRIERLVFNVGGGWWAQMMQRSSNFLEFAQLMGLQYPDPLDLVTLIHLSQSLFDHTDPIAFARHVISEPLAGRLPKRVLMQEGRYDHQVPNLTTRAVVRALGIPLLTPAVEPVHGVVQAAGPLPSAYVQWDSDPAVEPPPGNIPPPKIDKAEAPHELVRRTETFKLQLEKFLTPDGLVEQTCDGPCTCAPQQP